MKDVDLEIVSVFVSDTSRETVNVRVGDDVADSVFSIVSESENVRDEEFVTDSEISFVSD